MISVGDGVIAIDKNGNVTLLNIVAEMVTGWTKEEALGKPFEDIFNIFNEQTKEIVKNPVREVFDTGKIIELAEHTILISKQGNEIPIEDSAEPIKDKKGDIVGVVLVFRDITEKKKNQENIQYDSGKAVIRQIKKGIESEKTIEVVEGLNEGARIIKKPDNNITEGMKIKL